MKIRVLKDLPWAKVGEEVILTVRIGDRYNWPSKQHIYGVGINKDEIHQMAEDGWITFVEEKKTLKEKLRAADFSCASALGAIEICRQHFLEALPKEESYLMSGIGLCRKAIEESK